MKRFPKLMYALFACALMIGWVTGPTLAAGVAGKALVTTDTDMPDHDNDDSNPDYQDDSDGGFADPDGSGSDDYGNGGGGFADPDGSGGGVLF